MGGWWRGGGEEGRGTVIRSNAWKIAFKGEPRLGKDSSRGLTMVQVGSGWFTGAEGGLVWFRAVHDGSGWFRVVRVIPRGLRWCMLV